MSAHAQPLNVDALPPKPKADSDQLLCVEMLFPTLSDALFDGIDLVLLTCTSTTEATAEVIPSLSIIKLAKSKPHVVVSASELHSALYGAQPTAHDTPTNRSLTTIIAIAESAEYRTERFLDLGTIVFHRALDKTLQHALQGLATSLATIARQSLNVLNDQFASLAHERAQLPRGKTVSDTVSLFCIYIYERYGIPATYLNYDHKSGTWLSTQNGPGSVALQAELARANVDKLAFAKPISGYEQDHFYVLIPFAHDPSLRFVHHLIVLQQMTEFSAATIARIISHVEYYSTVVTHESQASLLMYLSGAAASLYSTFQRPESFLPDTYLDDFRALIDGALQATLQATNAFSATCRLYDPRTHGLALFVEVAHPMTAKIVADHASTVIPVRDWMDSVNAHTFVTKAHAEYTYIRNIPKLLDGSTPKPAPEKKKVYLAHRKDTVSELCLPLSFKMHTKIGTLNFESPLVDGFKKDIPFLQSVREGLEHWLALRLELNDKYWLAGRSQHYASFHELQQALDDPAVSTNVRVRIRQYLGTESAITDALETARLGELCDFWTSYVNRYSKTDLRVCATVGREYRRRIRARLSAACRLDVRTPDLLVSRRTFDMLTVILRNLLDNLRKHGDFDSDTLEVRQLRPRSLGAKGAEHGELHVLLRMSVPLYEDQLVADCLRPTHSSERAHYGLFICGMLARELSGFTYMHNVPDEGRAMLRITIPLGPHIIRDS